MPQAYAEGSFVRKGECREIALERQHVKMPRPPWLSSETSSCCGDAEEADADKKSRKLITTENNKEPTQEPYNRKASSCLEVKSFAMWNDIDNGKSRCKYSHYLGGVSNMGGVQPSHNATLYR